MENRACHKDGGWLLSIVTSRIPGRVWSDYRSDENGQQDMTVERTIAANSLAESSVVSTDLVEPAKAAPAGSVMTGLARVTLLDVGLPLLAYYGLHAVGISDYRALLAGTVVAGLRVGFVALSNRRLDGFAAFLMTVFAVGLALSFATGDARFMLAKDSVGTAVAGLIFLGSCVVGRPMSFYAAQRFSTTTTKTREWWTTMWQTRSAFRRGFRVMSMVWGIGLLAEAAVRIPLIYLLPVNVMVGISTVLQMTAFALLMTWNVWYAKRMRRPERDGLR